MRSQVISSVFVGSLALYAMGSASVFAGPGQTNGIAIAERVFNDFPATTLNVTNNFPSLVQFDESDFTGSGFANRHDALASIDGGATAGAFDINQGFSISANVTLDVGSNAPRKEAGIRISSPVTGDALFILNSDAGEIVAFGGGAPFQLFGNNTGGDGYTPGETIFMQMTYSPSGTFGDPGTVIYSIDRGNGIESSGPLLWSNLEGGPVNYSLGFYGQFSPELANVNEFARVSFENISIIPEPSSVLLAGMAFVALMAQRRRFDRT